jgi:hypothetical protein
VSKLTKVTEFVGSASGNGERFYFDELTDVERDAMWEKARAFDEWPEGFDPDIGRIYPSDLLPDNERGQRGRWRVTVEFEPESA